jgi:hypothetical protein
MLPHVDDENFRAGEREECTLSLKVLVLASLSTVGSLYVHNKKWAGGVDLHIHMPLVVC